MDLARDQHPENRRAAPGAPVDTRLRHRTAIATLRTAKLLCQSGEYLCFIRDVSAHGVKLGLFHDLPAISHAFLELANGEIHPMLGVWSGERQASFRFSQPIDPADLIAEAGAYPQRSPRLAIRCAGLVFADRLLRPMELRDLSTQGARFESDTRFSLGQALVLSLDAVPELSAWVRWRHGRSYGLVFDTALRLDQLAGYALALQPPAAPDAASGITRVA